MAVEVRRTGVAPGPAYGGMRGAIHFEDVLLLGQALGEHAGELLLLMGKRAHDVPAEVYAVELVGGARHTPRRSMVVND